MAHGWENGLVLPIALIHLIDYAQFVNFLLLQMSFGAISSETLLGRYTPFLSEFFFVISVLIEVVVCRKIHKGKETTGARGRDCCCY